MNRRRIHPRCNVLHRRQTPVPKPIRRCARARTYPTRYRRAWPISLWLIRWHFAWNFKRQPSRPSAVGWWRSCSTRLSTCTYNVSLTCIHCIRSDTLYPCHSVNPSCESCESILWILWIVSTRWIHTVNSIHDFQFTKLRCPFRYHQANRRR